MLVEVACISLICWVIVVNRRTNSLLAIFDCNLLFFMQICCHQQLVSLMTSNRN